LQVVSVAPGSPAEAAGVEVGDQIRSVNGRPTRELSLAQARRLLQGAPGTSVSLEIFRPRDNFRRLDLEVPRAARRGRPYELQVVRGTAVLTLTDFERMPMDDLRQELEDVRSRGVGRLLFDLRDTAEGDPRQIAALAGLFAEGTLLRLRDGSGRLVEVVEGDSAGTKWPGSLAVLVNGATAGAAEALAELIREMVGGEVYGEATYGLGAEPKLYELERGYGLLVSATRWETASGGSWNHDGIEPDHLVRGAGSDYAEARESQLDDVLDLLEEESRESDAPARAA
jgi:carboxyl-terminal processing protease